MVSAAATSEAPRNHCMIVSSTLESGATRPRGRVNRRGVRRAQAMDLGVRTWGNSSHGSTMMLTGTYQMSGEVSRRLLEALPPLLVLEEDAWDCALIPLLGQEIVKDEPGQEVV